jgi:hypothetical protein
LGLKFSAVGSKHPEEMQLPSSEVAAGLKLQAVGSMHPGIQVPGHVKLVIIKVPKPQHPSVASTPNPKVLPAVTAIEKVPDCEFEELFVKLV